MVRNMEKVLSLGPMGAIILESSLTIIFMERAYTDGLINEFMKASGP
jgi:hypothetical protein